jgi:formate hydrogenlyase subunit 6/NADH:ubiquinone oxidoreductase subunit I
LGEPERTSGDFFGIAVLNEKKCTGCRLCEDVCGWDAVHIFPLKHEVLKPFEELSPEEKVIVTNARKIKEESGFAV